MVILDIIREIEGDKSGKVRKVKQVVKVTNGKHRAG